MKRLMIAVLVLAACAWSAQAKSVLVAWDAPTTMVDGSVTSAIPAELTTELRYSVYAQVVGQTTWSLLATTTTNSTQLTLSLPAGKWNLAATAFFSGEPTIESDRSATLSVTVRGKPTPPKNLR